MGIVPATDVGARANPDLDVYAAVVRDVWPDLSSDILRQVALVGRVFRTAAAIDWGRSGFHPAWPEQTMWLMVKYRCRLRGLLEIAPWNN